MKKLLLFAATLFVTLSMGICALAADWDGLGLYFDSENSAQTYYYVPRLTSSSTIEAAHVKDGAGSIVNKGNGDKYLKLSGSDTTLTFNRNYLMFERSKTIIGNAVYGFDMMISSTAPQPGYTAVEIKDGDNVYYKAADGFVAEYPTNKGGSQGFGFRPMFKKGEADGYYIQLLGDRASGDTSARISKEKFSLNKWYSAKITFEDCSKLTYEIFDASTGIRVYDNQFSIAKTTDIQQWLLFYYKGSYGIDLSIDNIYCYNPRVKADESTIFTFKDAETLSYDFNNKTAETDITGNLDASGFSKINRNKGANSTAEYTNGLVSAGVYDSVDGTANTYLKLTADTAGNDLYINDRGLFGAPPKTKFNFEFDMKLAVKDGMLWSNTTSSRIWFGNLAFDMRPTFVSNSKFKLNFATNNTTVISTATNDTYELYALYDANRWYHYQIQYDPATKVLNCFIYDTYGKLISSETLTVEPSMFENMKFKVTAGNYSRGIEYSLDNLTLSAETYTYETPVITNSGNTYTAAADCAYSIFTVTQSKKSPLLIIAVYAENDEMLGCATHQVDCSRKGETADPVTTHLSASVTLDDAAKARVSYAKAYLWTELDSIKPYLTAVEVEY